MTYREEQTNPGMIRFDLPKHQTSIIKVIGVGGGGSNAVNHMFNLGITGVDFVVCNTDAQALYLSPVPNKIQLGATLTEGRGAGALPETGRNSALENIEDIQKILSSNTKMLFITAGMGGGTGTGAAPVIASVAREMGILTVGIVTLPFGFEGRKRKQQAEEGIQELRKHVDSLLVICNDRLRELYGDLRLSGAFNKADNILTTAAKGIAEIITVPGYINVDFEDVKTVMRNSGVAIMGSGAAEGEDRAVRAVEEALSSPLLNDNNIEGASNILLYISSGEEEVSMDEVTAITDFIQTQAGYDADIIWGNGRDPELGNKINITIIATGFEINGNAKATPREPEKKVIVVGTLGENAPIPAPKEIPAPEPLKEETLRQDEPRVICQLAEEPSDMQTIAEPKPEPLAEIPSVPEAEIPAPEEPALQSPQTQEVIFEMNQSIPEDQQISKPEPIREPDYEQVRETGPITAPITAGLEITEPTLIIRTPPAAEIHPEPAVQAYPSAENPGPDRIFMERSSLDRISKLKELSIRLKTEEGISRMEKEPAYVRRQVELVEPRPSGESEVSRFTVSEDPKGGIEIKTNNSFLHDNVD